jgi:hypothetical protein
MTSCDARDARLERLERLPSLAPDPRRAERVRVRCRARLSRSRPRTTRTAVTNGFGRRVLAAVVVGGICLLYVASLVTTTLRFHRVFQ